MVSKILYSLDKCNSNWFLHKKSQVNPHRPHGKQDNRLSHVEAGVIITFTRDDIIKMLLLLSHKHTHTHKVNKEYID